MSNAVFDGDAIRLYISIKKDIGYVLLAIRRPSSHVKSTSCLAIFWSRKFQGAQIFTEAIASVASTVATAMGEMLRLLI